jgi:GTPase Era involved in 16S rRNA processing
VNTQRTLEDKLLVGFAARAQIEKLLGSKIHLDRGVKVAKHWPRNSK